jgi:hypothetical protein
VIYCDCYAMCKRIAYANTILLHDHMFQTEYIHGLRSRRRHERGRDDGMGGAGVDRGTDIIMCLTPLARCDSFRRHLTTDGTTILLLTLVYVLSGSGTLPGPLENRSPVTSVLSRRFSLPQVRYASAKLVAWNRRHKFSLLRRHRRRRIHARNDCLCPHKSCFVQIYRFLLRQTSKSDAQVNTTTIYNP